MWKVSLASTNEFTQVNHKIMICKFAKLSPINLSPLYFDSWLYLLATIDRVVPYRCIGIGNVTKLETIIVAHEVMCSFFQIH